MSSTKKHDESVINEAREIVKNLKWREAKSYRGKAPHHYATNGDNDFKSLKRLADLIKEYGVTEYFYGHPDKYLHVDDKKYFGWYQPKGFWCINRAEADVYYGKQK